ncbi:MAG: SPOR domain-containing protein, partial [Anderseniella sp.]
LLNRALAYQQTGNLDAAIADYSSAIELDALGAKTRAVALYNRGIANSRQGRQALAVEDYTNALYLDPYLADAFYSRANALRETGQHEYALIDYARATKLDYAHKHLAFYGKALTLAEMGYNDEATAAFFKAYSIKPDFMPAREKLSALGLDLPENPSEKQLQLAQLPKQAVAADDIVTGSTDTPSSTETKVVLREPVAPPASLLDQYNSAAVKTQTAKIAAPATVEAPAQSVTEIKLDEPESFTVSSVGDVPVIAMPETATPEKVASEKPEVKPVVASAPASKPVKSETASLVTEKLQGWTVQLVSQRDAKIAWANWDKLKSRHGDLLSNRSAAVIQAEVAGQGIYYRLRVHQLDKAEAKDLCRNLKSKGTGCFVSKAAG